MTPADQDPEEDPDLVPYPEHVDYDEFYDDPFEEGAPGARVLPFPQAAQDVGAPPSPPPHGGVSLYRGVDDLEIESLPDPRWLIEPYIQEGAFVLLYSAPKVGKSFVALEWSLGLATGRLALGQAHARGPVAYIAAEGVGGYKKRVMAWKRDRQLGGRAGVLFYRGAYNLMNPVVVRDLKDALVALPERPRLLVVDTLARCAPGADENAAKDMGVFVQGIDQLRLSVGCAVLVIHHSGRAGSHERGSTALRGAADTIFSLEKRPAHLELVCHGQKDHDETPPAKLRLRTVALPGGETSCVVEAPQAQGPRVTPSALRLLIVLAEAFPAEEPTTGEWERAACQTHTTFCRNMKILRDEGMVEPKVGPNGAVVQALTVLGLETASSAGLSHLLPAAKVEENQ